MQHHDIVCSKRRLICITTNHQDDIDSLKILLKLVLQRYSDVLRNECVTSEDQSNQKRTIHQGFEIAEKDKYYVRRKSRDEAANAEYFKLSEEDCDGLYIRDIVRGGIKNDDPRIPRNLS